MCRLWDSSIHSGIVLAGTEGSSCPWNLENKAGSPSSGRIRKIETAPLGVGRDPPGPGPSREAGCAAHRRDQVVRARFIIKRKCLPGGCRQGRRGSLLGLHLECKLLSVYKKALAEQLRGDGAIRSTGPGRLN